MKLLFFIFALGGGGAERVTANLANYWAKNGHRLTIVTLASTWDDVYPLHPAVRRISLMEASPSANIIEALSSNYRRISALRETIKSESPDIAIGMMDSACVLLALAAHGLNVVRVGSVRVHPPRLAVKVLWRRLQAASYRLLDTVVAQSQETAAWLIAHTTAKDVAVIPNPVDWPLAVMEPKIEPKTLIKEERKLLLGAGRLDPQKGFDLLIDQFARLAECQPEWDLAIVGEGPERNRLQSMIDKSGMRRRIFLPGWAGNLPDWYRRADLYVMSSRFEGFPNTLAEAMAYGVPAVSFDWETGPRDIIRNDTDGLLVHPDDGPALMDALMRLMPDDALRQRLGIAASEVRDRFAMEAVARKWEDLFDRLLAARRGASQAELQPTLGGTYHWD